MNTYGGGDGARRPISARLRYSSGGIYLWSVVYNEKKDELRWEEEIQQTTATHEMDSLHLVSAEFGRVDVFLTTDTKLIRACRNTALRMRVMNPVSYLAEVIEDDGY